MFPKFSKQLASDTLLCREIEPVIEIFYINFHTPRNGYIIKKYLFLRDDFHQLPTMHFDLKLGNILV